MQLLHFTGLLLCLVTSTTHADLQLTKKIISQEEKSSILDAEDDATAFSNYMKLYDDVISSKLVNPTQVKNSADAQKKNFMHNLKMIREHNLRFARGEVSYSMTINSFTIMSGSERRQFLSLRNVSVANANESLETKRIPRKAGRKGKKSKVSPPTTLDWNERGWVSGVKDEGKCGSSWAFTASDLLEFAYKRCTGNMVQVSTQQLVDCAYNEKGKTNGCRGGYFTNAFDWIIENNHMAPMEDYGYTGKEGKCDSSSYTNLLEGTMEITGYEKVKPQDKKIVKALQIMPLAVGIKVEKSFFAIGGGVYNKGCTKSSKGTNHGLTLTGYTASYWKVKNCWGADWGENGYGRLARRGNICNILSNAYYITYNDLNSSDGQDPDDNQ